MTYPLSHLGDMPIETFLRNYWQKKPLLIRNAFPNFESPIDGDELAGLALEEEVESRLVLEHGTTPWELRNGPFDEETFATLPESHWTLLVQAVDQWVPEVHDLLQHFRFIPNWRLDDIMISYATDQGSVGPHYDYYDVFLLQGAGKRRWRIGQECDAYSEHLQDAKLNILQDFEQREEWVLEPGDMLYIPPGIAHWGIAQGECMTYSIGFRAPSLAELTLATGNDLLASLGEDARYQDPSLSADTDTGLITPSAIEQLRQQLSEVMSDERRLYRVLGSLMTEAKYPDMLPESQPAISWNELKTAFAEQPHWRRAEFARFAYHLEQHSCQFYALGMS